ncbi:OLC1v1029509C1 [Oldenlandia corymbosa var. corymbosa]|uniref:OLC1v1029509C1 n=1 Tax=Oldenlandia corymbosa var. corymbosa TaxID=529605 RepID=A0AAV1CEQ4_OLDCO|nr:OLC1v1029509C1 [Oldenlandia corymbosa var. corymbosa]
MANQRGIFYFVYALVLVSSLLLKCQCEERKIYIVYLGELPRGGDGDHDGTLASSLASTQHHSILNNVLGSASLPRELLVHQYTRSFNGFAARLTTEEAQKISRMEGVVSVIPNQVYHIQTTRSWEFMGFDANFLINHNPSLSHHGDVIVGILDSGIWPEHESFGDQGVGPVPARWKGSCDGLNFTCNKKLIGARAYSSEMMNSTTPLSARDDVGHGTHTSATVAGREIANASYYGIAKGVARGGFPNARIAMYKICSSNGCDTAGALKAFDDAIADGVDIISMSISGDDPYQYFNDALAIGSFHAMKNGVLTSSAAGNAGPSRASVTNNAPWLLTVAASTIDRGFNTRVMLGNGRFVNGDSFNGFKGETYPLVYGGDIANYTGGQDPYEARWCLTGILDATKLPGKIILCYPYAPDLVDLPRYLLHHHAEGVIVVPTPTPYPLTKPELIKFPLPATTITDEDSRIILDYIRSTENPFATILRTDEYKDLTAPTVADFSSRGPNPISPDILKPDITAPGVDILAAWPPNIPTSTVNDYEQRFNYNIASGTSMSCPHATAAAAYVKAVHPDWSPAAIKSALMTTSFRVDPRKHAEREFAYGAGHINPVAAADPGLVFDANETDYIQFLCKQHEYNNTRLKAVTGDNSTCNNVAAAGRGWDLNYPSFSLSLLDDQEINATFTRTVTNVGKKPSTYKASIQGVDSSTQFKVKVEPSTLDFSTVGEKKSFRVEVTGPKIRQQPIMSVQIVWKDGLHEVRTPVVVYNYIPGTPRRVHFG